MIATESLTAPTNLIGQVGGALALIVFIIVAAGWLLRRTGALRRLPQGSAALQIKESHTIGQREKLLLVEIGDRQLLLGVTAGQINCLATLDKSLSDAAPAASRADFRTTLGDLLKGRKA